MVSEIEFKTNITLQVNTQGLKNINNTFIPGYHTHMSFTIQ